MRDGKKASMQIHIAHVWIITGKEEILGGFIMAFDVTTKRDLGLQEDASHVRGLNLGSTEAESEGDGSVRDCVVDHIIGWQRRETEQAAGNGQRVDNRNFKGKLTLLSLKRLGLRSREEYLAV